MHTNQTPRSREEICGEAAVQNGQEFEDLIESILVERGFRPMLPSQWQNNIDTAEHLLLKQVPYTSIYGSLGRTEFLLKSPSLETDIRIEAKWQQSQGSTDEKLPYWFLNAIDFQAMPEPHILIVIEGTGWREGSLGWLREAAQSSPPGKRIDVMNLDEFISWTYTLTINSPSEYLSPD